MFLAGDPSSTSFLDEEESALLLLEYDCLDEAVDCMLLLLVCEADFFIPGSLVIRFLRVGPDGGFANGVIFFEAS